MNKRNPVKDALLGVAIGDALGVPVEFKSRKILMQHPVVAMTGYGTHNQPAGTWSDDSALTFCLAESLCDGYNLRDLASRFVNWYEYGYWTAHDEVFDIGIATAQAIWRLKSGLNPILAGGQDEGSNGNGSLMRILPLVFYTKGKNIKERFSITKEVSALTHGHIRAVIACFIYLEIAREILSGKDKFKAYEDARQEVIDFLLAYPVCPEDEFNRFHRLLVIPIGDYDIKPIYEYTEPEISASGYVLHTLEASIWCLLSTNNYREAVLKAVNLGDDTDTTGAVTGGLAGLLYGSESIPAEWLTLLAKRQDIEELAARLAVLGQ